MDYIEIVYVKSRRGCLRHFETNTTHPFRIPLEEKVVNAMRCPVVKVTVKFPSNQLTQHRKNISDMLTSMGYEYRISEQHGDKQTRLKFSFRKKEIPYSGNGHAARIIKPPSLGDLKPINGNGQ